MRQYLCDVCLDELTSHTTDVRGVPEALCDSCLAPPGWARLGLWDQATRLQGLARARAYLRKQQYWREEEANGPGQGLSDTQPAPEL